MQSPDAADVSKSPSDGGAVASRLQWIAEGTYEVSPGVYRIPLPLPFDGLRAVNTYAIEADDGLVMIDSGWVLEETKDQLERSLAKIGAGLRRRRKFLITHIHRDHYTQAIALSEVFGTKVALGVGEKPSPRRAAGAGRRAADRAGRPARRGQAQTSCSSRWRRPACSAGTRPAATPSPTSGSPRARSSSSAPGPWRRSRPLVTPTATWCSPTMPPPAVRR